MLLSLLTRLFGVFFKLIDYIYDDKNYHVEMKNAIIICTSNYLSEDDIRSKLGDPIYSRFDEIIKFDNKCRKSVVLSWIFGVVTDFYLDYESRGQGFESLWAHQKKPHEY